MLDEEVIIKTERNNSERLLFANVIILLVVSTVAFGGNTEFVKGLLIAMGIIPIINVFTYRYTWIDAKPHTRTYFVLGLIPSIISIIIAFIGVEHPLIDSVILDNHEFWKLNNDDKNLIVSAATNVASALMPVFLGTSAVAIGLSVYFITESRYILRRILFWGAFVAFAFAFAGIVYEIICLFDNHDRFPLLGESSFSTFADSQQWSSFALLWCGASITVAIYTAQRFRLVPFIYSFRATSLFFAFILLLTILYTGTPLVKVLALGISALGSFILAYDTYPSKKNLKRHSVSRSLRNGNSPIKYYPFISYFISGVLCVVASVVLSISVISKNPAEFVVSDNSDACITLAEKQSLFMDSMKLIEERPIFGWGAGSFQSVFSFIQGCDLGDSSWLSPCSDFLHSLVEGGFVGFILALLVPMCFLFLWIIRFDFSLSAIVLFATVSAVLVVSLVDYPFQSPSVYISFWIIMMAAFRWDNAEIR